MPWFMLSPLCVALVAAVPCSGQVVAEEPQREDRSVEALRLTQQVARSLQLFGGEDRTTKLTLVDSPLQRYSNPVVGDLYAHLFIWTNRGRPEAAASIARWYAPKRALHLELQSLAVHPIAAEYRQQWLWQPAEAGVAYQRFSDTPAPSPFAAARLREMRQLAREFQVRIKAENRGGDIDEELRLLAQPIYRYESGRADIVDGTVFSFVRGTDPELLLLIEAAVTAEGSAWQYALAPMNSFEFHAFHRGREVWQAPQLAPPWPNVRDPSKPYMVIFDFDEQIVSDELQP